MSEYEQFLSVLNEYPRINTFCVYTDEEQEKPLLYNGKAVEAQTIKVKENSRAEAETVMMAQCNKIMEGNRSWIRIMPDLREYEEDGRPVCTGRARIAVMPIN